MAELMVDIDEVIFPLGDSIHELGHEFGLHDNSMPWSEWEAWKQYGCHPDAYWDLWITFANRDGYLKTPPIPGAVEALRWLYWEGHTIHLVTARGFMTNADKIRAWTPTWLEEFAVPHHTLTFARNKPAAQEELGVKFDFAIDDSPKNYRALDRAGIEVYLQDHTHNHDDQTPGLRRVPNLWEWAHIIEKRRAA